MKEFFRLGDRTIKIGSGQTPAGGHSTYVANGIPLIRSQNVLMGSFSEEGLAYISDSVDATMSTSRVLPGDVLLNITGASIGRVCVVPNEICPANVNQHVCIIRPDSNLSPDYLAAFLSSPSFQSFVWKSQAGGTRQALTKQMIENFKIPSLSFHEQRAISRVLKAQMAEVKVAMQGENDVLRDTGLLANRVLNSVFAALPGSPAMLGDLLAGIESGKSFQTADTPAKPDELGVLKVSAVTWSEFRPNEAKALKSSYLPQDHHKVRKNDLLISRANTRELVGAVVLVGSDYPFRLLSDKTLRLIVDESRASKEYLLYALRGSLARKHIEHFATGTSESMRNISQGVIASIPVVLPTLSEQHKIVSRLKHQLGELANAHKSAQKQLQDIQALPAKLLSKAFESLV